MLLPLLQLLEGEHCYDDEHKYPDNNGGGHNNCGRVYGGILDILGILSSLGSRGRRVAVPIFTD